MKRLSDLPGIRAEHRFPDHVCRPYATAFVHLDPAIGRTAAKIIAALLGGEPSIAVMNDDDPRLLRVDVRILADDEAEVVATRLREVLAAVPVA